ncbi:MAG: hypothetical protein K8R25_05405 [Methanosarcinales archaeon]|nr:hypothetical protein [Methanosarcinales archaeon]
MSDIFNTISIIVNLASIILALIGLFFVIGNWRVWKRIGSDIIKAKAFLNKGFLEWNWIGIVVVGALIVTRRVFRFFELMTDEIMMSHKIEVIFDVIGFLVIFLLFLIAYQWYKLIHSHNRVSQN